MLGREAETRRPSRARRASQEQDTPVARSTKSRVFQSEGSGFSPWTHVPAVHTERRLCSKVTSLLNLDDSKPMTNRVIKTTSLGSPGPVL